MHIKQNILGAMLGQNDKHIQRKMKVSMATGRSIAWSENLSLLLI